jgi:deoxyhypusine synthase
LICSNFLSFASAREIGVWIKECGGLEGELFKNMLPTYCDWLEDTDTEAKREKIVRVYDFIVDT